MRFSLSIIALAVFSATTVLGAPAPPEQGTSVSDRAEHLQSKPQGTAANDDKAKNVTSRVGIVASDKKKEAKDEKSTGASKKEKRKENAHDEKDEEEADEEEKDEHEARENGDEKESRADKKSKSH
ncbi:hypothetical protein BDA99DRAFT_562265 [Phascolomyces articulosus]|uniref:Uncharacterized protein n=1 Tax=Phascolomyces articulosus TaxID=60185 RepID=A0AAD5JV77_9FUNG|nr:hypothetical protein BDA99DRAFT_562265 [Phascolomyces articulosus]